MQVSKMSSIDGGLQLIEDKYHGSYDFILLLDSDFSIIAETRDRIVKY